MTSATTTGDNCLDRLEKEAKDKKAAADAAATQATELRTQSDQLSRLVAQLEAALSAYAQARAEVKPQIDELDSRLEAIRKNLCCKVSAECRSALDNAFSGYPDALDAARTEAAAYGICQDDDSIPGRQAAVAAAQTMRDGVQAAMDAVLHEPDGLRQRVAALVASVTAIEAIVCARDGDQVRAYVRYLQADAALAAVFNQVDPDDANVDQALACRLEELKDELAELAQNVIDANQQLADLEAQQGEAEAVVADMTLNGGIDWLVKQAGAACTPEAAAAAPEAPAPAS